MASIGGKMTQSMVKREVIGEKEDTALTIVFFFLTYIFYNNERKVLFFVLFKTIKTASGEEKALENRPRLWSILQIQ